MDPRIEPRNEGPRGCGRRDKKGALYLVDLDPEHFRPCAKLPLPLGPCPCCGGGIKPSRQWVWIESDALLEAVRRQDCPVADLDGCPGCALDLGAMTGRAGLLWVGERFYTPDGFLAEVKRMGISRRVNFVPHGFKLGETWVFLAHISAVRAAGKKEGEPGIIAAYRPRAVEVVCDGTETKEEIDGYISRGLTPVKIEEKEEAL